MPRMTRASPRASGLVIPTPLQLLLNALLRVWPGLVLQLAMLTGCLLNVFARKCDAAQDPKPAPASSRETQDQSPAEATAIFQSGPKVRVSGGGRSPAALRTRAKHAIVFQRESSLSAIRRLSPRAFPAKAGTQPRLAKPIEPPAAQHAPHAAWMPVFTGNTRIEFSKGESRASS